MQTPRSGAPRRLPVPLVVLLLVGALATVVGEGWFLTAKAAVANSAQRSNSLPTLPVHVYAQYTQHLPAVDTSGLWTGLLIAGLGIAVLLAAAVVAIRRSSVR
ncbi:hypothetical protein SAMN04515691_3238 [Leifsonia sp. 98AMF]|uniref:hypothetical protein n=1 Tax=unclassified Leifsonia TaxID=2663824 RepID=UPI00087BA62F|nr:MULTISPECIES: hypothetical protein [unclassified Leifsonia]SDH11237.1 hypothetical protein SAMN04515690_0778 [Leifsonia sp. 197AMF]SDJ27507.1 hypothetical protein SAMN04515684_3004 [Leifsonia sp. 466MF]SDK53757.1 hypothetical protein SAMN04515683_3760 [Leifsonia sp. 157MF]SDN49534.1 hypothetical protein SAMN04515686_1189 [Leifsonia sp. 509MF]SEN60994.1 hypothetical protein SAMN04515685_3742 [Leifsonia sp. 467MF]